MPVPTFRENCTTFNSSTMYNVTNEEPDLLVRLLGNRSFRKAAGISSAGEILLSVILPRCREVIAVDHSYAALAIAYLKAVMLNVMGAQGLKDLLFDSKPEQVIAAMQQYSASLPQELTPHLKLPAISQYDIAALRREWFYLPTAALERARRRLDKVTFVHGDIMDLAADGQFSLLYVSNAIEHFGRAKKYPKLVDFAKLVRPGGFLLATAGTPTTAPASTKEWEHVKSIKGLRTTWIHTLYKRMETA